MASFSVRAGARLPALRSRLTCAPRLSTPPCSISSRTSSSSSSTAAGAGAARAQDGPADKQQIRMLILGSPGAGKGTQSGRLRAKYELELVVGGDVLRDEVGRGTDIGKRAKEVMTRGELMPDEIMMELMTAKVISLGDKNFLLDGFPRTLGQAKKLDEALTEAGRPLTLVANLDVPEEVILGRVLDRWVHMPSGRTYNLSYNPPKVAGKDDVTGEPLSKRPDDNVETFAARLQSYHALTEPLREYFAGRSDSKTADGLEFVNLAGRTSDEIWPKLERALERRYPWLQPKA